jgi:hypothetical protein
MKNLLIIGGCHVTNETFIKEIRSKTNYKNIRKIHAHFRDKNFKDKIEVIKRKKEDLNLHYDLIIQLGNWHFKNTILNFISNSRESLLSFYNEQKLNNKTTDKEITNERPSFFFRILDIFRILIKITIFPISLIYVPISGFIYFYKLKKMIVNAGFRNKTIIFNPLKSMNLTDNIFELMGSSIVNLLFKNAENIKIFDFYHINFNEDHYRDQYHLNENGIKLFTQELLEKQLL